MLYQIYVRSFADSNGDGQGDLQGVIDHLDHLTWLGVDGIWLNPITPSPNADWGYDVSDYTAVDPEFGDFETLELLAARARESGMGVILDLVPNHTSDRHPWFVEARSGRSARRRDWYVWADGKPGAAPPNNWVSAFGGPAWTWDERTGQYYLHNFLPEQPDLNWWNEEVREAFERILRFWLDLGIAGFRIDVANGLVKDRGLRDNPAITDEDHPQLRPLGVRPVYNMNRPEVHDVYRRWRTIVDSYGPSTVLMGETWLFDMESLMRYYGTAADELHLALNFPFIFTKLGAEMRAVVESTESALPRGAWPVWTGSNHDAGRFPTRWCGGNDRMIRAALLILLTLRGTPVLYYGDEIGMPDVAVPREAMTDPVGLRHWPEDPGRDGGRTPMQWNAEPTGGFTRPGVQPWLPLGDPMSCNVADQREDHMSMLHFCRDLIALRRANPDLRTGGRAPVDAPDGVWAWRRGDHTLVAVNLSDLPAEVALGAGEVLVATRRDRRGEGVEGSLHLDPWEAVVASDRPKTEPRHGSTTGDDRGGA